MIPLLAVSTGMLILIIVIILLVAGLPRWPHSRNWGYGPTGILGVILIILLILWLLGHIAI